jgi:four helix bundle protein
VENGTKEIKTMKYQNLENRLINFSVEVIKTAKELPSDFIFDNLKKQLVRSAVSPTLNYAEASGAESRRDFLHKMKIALKELRETHVTLKIISGTTSKQNESIVALTNECNQLISIFVASCKTASQKKN